MSFMRTSVVIKSFLAKQSTFVNVVSPNPERAAHVGLAEHYILF